ncbi:MAG TPA: hypothetical protein VLE19_02165 [Pyrinomonadaceae bacterium]|nr:hypothetical protein [Pyrinomonadaceae bacterium]
MRASQHVSFNRSIPFFFAVLSLFFVYPVVAFACTCPSESDQRAFRRLRSEADIIFVGTARGSVTNGGMNFTVERYWKGKPKSQTFVFTAQNSSCAVAFADGEKYLVIAFVDDKGDINTNQCLRPGRVCERAMYIKRLGRGRRL